MGSSVSFLVHQAPGVARPAPPFRLRCVYTDVEPERRLRAVVTGDLSGVLETLFREEPDRDGTRVTFHWYVRVTNPVLNTLGYLIESLYRHSHDSVMKAGETGLSNYLRSTEQHPRSSRVTFGAELPKKRTANPSPWRKLLGKI